MKLIHDYQIIAQALENNLPTINDITVAYTSDSFILEFNFGKFEVHEVSNYLFDVSEIFYNNETGNEYDMNIKLQSETLADCINYINKIYQEYLEDLEQLQLEENL